MNIKDIYQPFINQLEGLVQQLDSEFEKPIAIPYGDHFVFRHRPQVRSDILASYLKLVRIVSLLNAGLNLMEKGFVQEIYILCRAIDEAAEDITFFALKMGETGTSPKQMKMLKEFYQEQLENPTDPLSSISRDRVGRKDIRAAISNIPIEAADSHTMRVVTKSLFEVFSGFVHGAYVHIMEMYGGRTPKYHMRGMPDSPYMIDCVDNFANHLYRSVIVVESVASRVARKDVVLNALKLSCGLAETTGCVDEEGIQYLKNRIARATDLEKA
jgi:hypothetical protein